MDLRDTPPIKKRNIYSMTKGEWDVRNRQLPTSTLFQNLVLQVGRGNNDQRQHQQLAQLLEDTFKDCFMKVRDTMDWDAGKVLERKFADHVLFQRYRVGKEQGKDGQRIQLPNEMSRSD